MQGRGREIRRRRRKRCRVGEEEREEGQQRQGWMEERKKEGRRAAEVREGGRKGAGRVCVLCQHINTWTLKFV